ncbi:MAG: hypothetical protein KDK89_23535 [Alphaproteobacteria bacterium]|nr:hypothetical protein [Alphaproteobacteria bacterium]
MSDSTIETARGTKNEVDFLTLIGSLDANERAFILLGLQKTVAAKSKSWRTRYLRETADSIKQYRSERARMVNPK